MKKPLGESTILFGLTGSKAYGTDTDASDADYRGVYIPDETYYFGVKEAKERTFSSGGQGKNTKDDVDITLSPLISFVKRCVSGSPTDLEMLFLKDNHYMGMTHTGEELIKNRSLFLSKRVKDRFGGYALSQKKQMMKGSGVDEVLGYDPKRLMHSVRLYQMGIDILKHGDFSVFRENNETLKSLRAGVLTLEQATSYLEKLEMEIQSAHDMSQLPQQVDTDKVDNLLVNITKAHFSWFA